MKPIIVYIAGAATGIACMQMYYRLIKKPKPHIQQEIDKRLKYMLTNQVLGDLESAETQDLVDFVRINARAAKIIQSELNRRTNEVPKSNNQNLSRHDKQIHSDDPESTERSERARTRQQVHRNTVGPGKHWS